MQITITKGTGTGKTLLSAFDGALHSAGVYNYNLLILSSVIPPHSEIVKEKYNTPDSEYGDKLYCVKAEMRSDQAGKYIGAGIGYYQLEDNRGVFVEHEAIDVSRESLELTLESDIMNSLRDLCANRGYPIDESKMHIELNISQVTDSPACVIVMAIYQSETWK